MVIRKSVQFAILSIPIFTVLLIEVMPFGLRSTQAMTQGDARYFAFSASGPPFLDISGYQVNCRLELFRTDPVIKRYPFRMGEKNYELVFKVEEAEAGIFEKGEKIMSISLAKALEGIESYLKNHPTTSVHAVPQEIMKLEVNSAQLAAKIYFYNLAGRMSLGRVSVDHLKSDILLKLTTAD